MTELYQKHIRKIEAMSRNASVKYGFEFEECFAEANLVFCECVQMYKHKIGNFESYMSTAIRNRFLFLYKEQKKYNSILTDNEIEYEKASYEPVEKITMRHNFTPKGEMVIKLIQNLMKKEKVTQKTVYSALRRMGWNMRQIYHTFESIRKSLREVNV